MGSSLERDPLLVTWTERTEPFFGTSCKRNNSNENNFSTRQDFTITCYRKVCFRHIGCQGRLDDVEEPKVEDVSDVPSSGPEMTPEEPEW